MPPGITAIFISFSFLSTQLVELDLQVFYSLPQSENTKVSLGQQIHPVPVEAADVKTTLDGFRKWNS